MDCRHPHQPFKTLSGLYWGLNETVPMVESQPRACVEGYSTKAVNAPILTGRSTSTNRVPDASEAEQGAEQGAGRL